MMLKSALVFAKLKPKKNQDQSFRALLITKVITRLLQQVVSPPIDRLFITSWLNEIPTSTELNYYSIQSLDPTKKNNGKNLGADRPHAASREDPLPAINAWPQI